MLRQSLTFCFALVVAFVACAEGQKRSIPFEPRLPGIPRQPFEIQVILVLPSGYPAKMKALVELMTSVSVPVQQTYADADGRARLVTETPGHYRIKVSAPEIGEAHSQTFALVPSVYFHTEMIEVKVKDDTQPTGGPAIVASAFLKAPKKARELYKKGNDALLERRWQEALDHLQKAADIYPQFDAAHNAMGVAYMNLGERQRGIECFENALGANPQNSSALQNMAKLYVADENYAQAENLLTKALSLDPLNPRVLLLLALAQAGDGRLTEAVATARKLHSLPHAAQAEVHIIAARAFEQKKVPHEAAAEYRTYLKEAPSGSHAESARRAVERIEAANTATSQPN